MQHAPSALSLACGAWVVSNFSLFPSNADAVCGHCQQAAGESGPRGAAHVQREEDRGSHRHSLKEATQNSRARGSRLCQAGPSPKVSTILTISAGQRVHWQDNRENKPLVMPACMRRSADTTMACLPGLHV
eukprot:1150220-Pelagomonas_calceolata.AAC.4